MIDTVWGSTNKPASAKQLANGLSSDADLDGTLYVGYPIIGTPDGAFPFDALLLSPQKGAIAFDLVEGKDLGEFRSRQDDLFAKLQSKLLQYPALVSRRTLQPLISVVTFAPGIVGVQNDPEFPVLDANTLQPAIKKIDWTDNQTFPALSSAIQSLTTVRKNRRVRALKDSNSRGARLHALGESIATLDANQNAAVVETVPGVQRIRGLAGSGKTIVLALKVAYLHAQNPDWRIAVTFNTRSLKGQFERLITSFVYEQTSVAPDWSRIDILHSWGSSSSSGIYYNFVKDHGLVYRDFKSAQIAFGEGKEFQGATEEAISQLKSINSVYDAILIDEAQDLPSSFLRMCYFLVKPPHRLVYAYDELQTLTNASLPGPEELFGNDLNGNPLVVFATENLGQARQDIILEKCYRNSRPVLATAHALGFGIYRQPGGLIQMFEQNHLWQDVGYRVRDGKLEDGSQVSLERTPETSPTFLESHSPTDDLIQFHAFGSYEAQDKWLTDSIMNNLQTDDLLAEDIVVINPDPLKTRKAVGSARAILWKAGINSSLAGVSTSPDVFFEKDVVTFTGIFRAKGNESGMVYIINAHDCYDSNVPAIRSVIRNRLFTAITRSKAWVRVLGVGSEMIKLKREFDDVVEHQFRLDFVYPDEETRKRLRIVNRDLTRTERSRLSAKVGDLESTLEAFESGDIRLEDIPEGLRERFKEIFGQ